MHELDGVQEVFLMKLPNKHRADVSPLDLSFSLWSFEFGYIGSDGASAGGEHRKAEALTSSFGNARIPGAPWSVK